MTAGECARAGGDRRRCRAVSDHRGQSRRRHLSVAALAAGRRAVRHRQRQQCLHQPDRGTALAGLCARLSRRRRDASRPGPRRPRPRRRGAGAGAARPGRSRRASSPTWWCSTPSTRRWSGAQGDALLDAWLFAGNATPVRHVMVAGRWVVQHGAHVRGDEIVRGVRGAPCGGWPGRCRSAEQVTSRYQATSGNGEGRLGKLDGRDRMADGSGTVPRQPQGCSNQMVTRFRDGNSLRPGFVPR